MCLRPSNRESESNSGSNCTEFFLFSTWQKLLETPSHILSDSDPTASRCYSASIS